MPHKKNEKLKKAEEERRKSAGKGGRPEGGALTLEVRVRRTGLEDEGPQPPPLVEEEHRTPNLKVRSHVKNGLPPPPPALVAPTRAARTPRSAASTGTLSAYRPLGLMSSSLKRDRAAAPRMRIRFSGSP